MSYPLPLTRRIGHPLTPCVGVTIRIKQTQRTPLGVLGVLGAVFYAMQRFLFDFLRAEEKGPSGQPIDGFYHRYTDEFKADRAKHEVWVSVGKGHWQRNETVSDAAWYKYLLRNYKEDPVWIMQKDMNKNPTGQVYRSSEGGFRFVKQKNIEIREENRDGGNMVDAKWLKLNNIVGYDSQHKPIYGDDQTPLEKAQTDFYKMFKRVFEDELLEKLPMGIRDRMLGKAPLVLSTLLETAMNKPDWVTKMWARTTQSAKNLFTNTSHQKRVHVDENGMIVDTLPIFMVGNPRSEKALANIQDELEALKKSYLKKEKDSKGNLMFTLDEYRVRKAELNGQAERLRLKPTKDEISQDMGDSLLKFSAMAENYEIMGTIEDTYKALLKILVERTYEPAGSTSLVANIKGKLDIEFVETFTKDDSEFIDRIKLKTELIKS